MLKGRAYDKKITTLYLLTETAVDYFLKLGFSISERIDAPKEIVRTRQFDELCPSTAKIMRLDIAGN